ncbi:MAG: hypothetical protein NXY59_05995 [Aigarchaeota archaeon]|nr:hypothetical protein [Candidatus Pelearchaeum maunauluense]
MEEQPAKQLLIQALESHNVSDKLVLAFLEELGRSPEIFAVVKDFEPLIDASESVANGQKYRITMVDEEVFRRDVEEFALAEIMASKLLLSYTPLINADETERYGLTYRSRIIVELLKSLVAEHKLAALALRIKPAYFLYEKLKRFAAVFPPARYRIWRALRTNVVKNAINRFVEAAHTLVEAGIMERDGEFFRITRQGYDSLHEHRLIDVRKLEDTLRNYLSWPFLTKAAVKVFLEQVSQTIQSSKFSDELKLPDPSSYIYMQTSKGLQPLSEQHDIMDLAKYLYGDCRAEISHIGGALNSTYLLKVYTQHGESIKIFVKKYLNWTDVKWIIARVWTLGVKNFSLSSGSRMANEIYFIDLLKNYGFNTAEILHVNWRRRILFLNYVEGINLLDAWIKSIEGRERFAFDVGRCLAEIHAHDITIGDCKPEVFIKTSGSEIYITDLEQASLHGDKAWDVMEIIFYPGHYLDVKEAQAVASAIVEGYLTLGDMKIIQEALKAKYIRTLTPWTPVWVQRSIIEAVKPLLRA